MSTSVTQRLQALRDEIQFLGLNAWLVTSADPHLSEHLPEHWMFLRYLSGFTGSYGCMVITADRALLWTDSRYWEQAARQLEGSGIELMRFGAEGVVNGSVRTFLKMHRSAAIRLPFPKTTSAALKSLFPNAE